MDVSAWWVVGAFVIGGYAGALLVALITMAASDGDSDPQNLDGGGITAKAGPGPRWGV